jgi:hypothetical protein
MDAYAHITEAIEYAFSEQTCLREHELIRICKHHSLSPFDELNLSYSLDLFRAHFIMRHCLYALQDKWRSEQSADLIIELVVITKLPYASASSGANAQGFATDTIKESEISHVPLLKQYYSDLDNLINISESEVEFLLKGFWQRLENDAQRTRALTILSLTSEASYQEIKARFRKLAQKAHPDKGGSTHEFQEILEAKQTLEELFR